MSDSASSSSDSSSSSSSLSSSMSSSPVSSSPVASSSAPQDDSVPQSDSNRISVQEESSSLQFALSTEDNHALSGTHGDQGDQPMSMSELVAVPEPGENLHVSSSNTSPSSGSSSSRVSSSRASSSSKSGSGGEDDHQSESHYSESGRAPDPEIPFLPSPPPAANAGAAKRTATSLPPIAAKPNKQQQQQQQQPPVAPVVRAKAPSSTTNQLRASTGQPREAAKSRSSLPPIGAHRVPTAPPKPHHPQTKRRKPSPSKKAVVSSSYGNIYRYPFPRVARSPPKTAKRSGWLVGRTEMEESALSIDKTPKHPHPPKSADQARDGRNRHIEELLAPNRPMHDAAPPTGRRAQRYAAKWLQLHDDHEPSRPDGIMRSLDIARDGKTNRHQVGVNNPLQFEFNPYQSATSRDNTQDGTVLAIEGPEDEGLVHVRGGRIVTPEGEESARRPDSEEVSVHSDAPPTNRQGGTYDKDAHDMARWLVDFSLRYACDWHARDIRPAVVAAPPPSEGRQRVVDDVPAAAIWATQFALSRAMAANDEDVAHQALDDERAAAALASAAEEEVEEEDPQARAERLLVAGCVDRAIDRAIGVHTMWEFHAALERDESSLEGSALGAQEEY